MIQRTKKYRLGRRSHPPSFQVAKPDACCLKRSTTLVPRHADVKRDFHPNIAPSVARYNRYNQLL